MQGLKNFRNLLQGPTLQQSLLLQGLHSSSSGQAPENDAAKDMAVVDDNASSAVRRPRPAISVDGLRSGRTPHRIQHLPPRAAEEEATAEGQHPFTEGGGGHNDDGLIVRPAMLMLLLSAEIASICNLWVTPSHFHQLLLTKCQFSGSISNQQMR